MGRSAKMMKRPTQKQRAISKIAKAAAQPLAKEDKAERVEEAAAVQGAKKKRKSMRAKADKVGLQTSWGWG